MNPRHIRFRAACPKEPRAFGGEHELVGKARELVSEQEFEGAVKRSEVHPHGVAAAGQIVRLLGIHSASNVQASFFFDRETRPALRKEKKGNF